MDVEALKASARDAFRNDDHAAIAKLLSSFPALREAINAPVGPFGSPAITHVKSREMLDVLLEAGANIDAKSDWWAGGFGLLHTAEPELARYAIERGAAVDVHAAARLGLKDQLVAMLDADPELINARGGDGQLPLHFATSIEIADILLERGADIDARDLDHESTAAQWMVRDRQDVARHLVSRGCATDLLLASVLGEIEIARAILERDPDAIHLRVSDEHFPMVGGSSGGTIYQWTLGWYVSPHQVAKDFGHSEMLDFLMTQSPDDVKLLNLCWFRGEPAAKELLAEKPELAELIRQEPLSRHLAHAARNDEPEVAMLMLELGFPADSRSQHNATALHWACWHGNVSLVQSLINAGADLEDRNNDFQSSPLGWTQYASEHVWNSPHADYPAVVKVLLEAGVQRPTELSGSPSVREALS